MRATSSGRRQPWPVPETPAAPAEAGGLMPGPGAEPDEPGSPDEPGDGELDGLAGAGPDGVRTEPDGAAAEPGAGPDGAGAGPDGADALGWVVGPGASCVQAAMITRLLAGAALPPTPPRSIK